MNLLDIEAWTYTIIINIVITIVNITIDVYYYVSHVDSTTKASVDHFCVLYNTQFTNIDCDFLYRACSFSTEHARLHATETPRLH